ncbi:MAG: hypothetical protein JNG86_03615 [Verrucomicrobiaceae bacterium]|nr:hypothetical protein [Verrucomicrobiaceae bacterium]
MTVSDISPEALARLEAKLLADLEVVRKMRALVEEHRQPMSASAAPPPAPAAVPAPAVPATPAPPRKTIEEAARECLAVLGGKTFTQEELRRAMHKANKFYPDAAGEKQVLKRMIREGKVAVEERRTGRIGSLYRCTLPAPAAEENNPGGEPPATS